MYASEGGAEEQWERRDPSSNALNLVSVAVDSNGLVLAAAALLDDVYISYDLGSSWKGVSSLLSSVIKAESLLWRAVVISSDGRQVVAAADIDGIYFIDTTQPTAMPTFEPTFRPLDIGDFENDGEDDENSSDSNGRSSGAQILTMLILIVFACLIVAVIAYRTYSIRRGDWSRNLFAPVPARATAVRSNDPQVQNVAVAEVVCSHNAMVRTDDGSTIAAAVWSEDSVVASTSQIELDPTALSSASADVDAAGREVQLGSFGEYAVAVQMTNLKSGSQVAGAERVFSEP